MSANSEGRNAAPRMRWRTLALVLLASSLSTPFSLAAEADRPRLVVVLYPNESDGAPGIFLANQRIRTTFDTESAARIEVRNEYVDASRLHDADFCEAHLAYLQQKYAGRQIDLVIAVLSSGLDFAVAHRSQLFPGVPIVYCGVDERELKARSIPRDVVGSPIRMDLADTLDLAIRLHPNTQRVFVTTGSAPFDLYWEAEARKTFGRYEDRIEFTYLSGPPMDELLARVANLPEGSIVYHLHVHSDGTGKPFIPADALKLIAKRANVPVYSHVGTYIGRGIVGGRVFDFENTAQNAARLGLRLLAGEEPESIGGLVPADNAYTFDWRQLRRWGIDERDLPSGSIVKGREVSFWDDYKWHIVGLISFSIVEAVLIAALLFQRVKRRGAEKRFRDVVENSSAGMLVVGRDGKITLVNGEVVKLFGYRKEELLGQPVEILLPDRFRPKHSTYREQYFAAPGVRRMGQGRELFAIRKDGTEFPVEIGLSPLKTARGTFVLASIVDLTEHKRDEEGLRASRRELQLLTRRLLEAQEAERRRIARELHDDLNQSLALLSVEMELLAQNPPESADDFLNRMHELMARVGELSSSVHDLSHQLHPSKVEQIGLIAAIRGLCKELGQSHGLDVKFTHYDVPGPIPEDLALCLYRIVQEALRNVIKHGGTQQASVEVRGTKDAILLRIADDGVGFDPGSVTVQGGLGLVSMRERLNLVGGELAIESRPSQGTRINARIPFFISDRSSVQFQLNGDEEKRDAGVTVSETLV